MNKQERSSSPAPVQRLVGQIRAFLVRENTRGVEGVAFAESAGKARMICLRSAHDCGYRDVSIKVITVKRAPEFDLRKPKLFRNRYFSAEYMPNDEITGPGEKP